MSWVVTLEKNLNGILDRGGFKYSKCGEIFNDGRDAILVMSSAYYDRTCLWSADISTLVWQ